VDDVPGVVEASEWVVASRVARAEADHSILAAVEELLHRVGTLSTRLEDKVDGGVVFFVGLSIHGSAG